MEPFVKVVIVLCMAARFRGGNVGLRDAMFSRASFGIFALGRETRGIREYTVGCAKVSVIGVYTQTLARQRRRFALSCD